MKILEHIAQDIVEKTSKIIQYPISITNNEGVIIGSTDIQRIGIFHHPSLEVINRDRMVICKNETIKNILPGVSAPLKFNNKVIGVLGVVGNPEEVEKYVQLVKNQVEMLCQDAFHKEMVELRESMIDMFINQLIHYKESENSEHIIQIANLLDFDIAMNRVCLLVTVDLSRISLSSFQLEHSKIKILSYLRLIFEESKNDIVSNDDVMKFVILKALPYRESHIAFIDSLEGKLERLNLYLNKTYQTFARLSVGDVGNQLDGLTRSYYNARIVMKLGLQYNSDSNLYIYNKREVMIKMLPTEFNTNFKDRLLKLIEPLIYHDNYDVLSSTFIGFCKNNMNLSEASRNLYIHRNTIIYRLDKIKEITKLNTSNFEQCMLLYTAIQYYENFKKQK